MYKLDVNETQLKNASVKGKKRRIYFFSIIYLFIYLFIYCFAK